MGSKTTSGRADPRIKILFVHNAPATFVRQDLALLAETFQVHEIYARSPAVPAPWTVAAAVARADLVVCWFASWHALQPVLLARLFHRPSLVIVGGYDVAAVPEIGYGLQRGGIERVLSRLVMRSSTRVLPFSRSAANEAVRHAGVPERRLEVVPLGVPDAIAPDGSVRERLVLTVARVDQKNLRRKGLLVYAETSRLVPEVDFAVVGALSEDGTPDLLRRSGGPNLRLLGALSDAERDALYARAAAYLQLSVHEGFGLALAEAMRAGCIPIVTRAGSLPEVVGDTGWFVSDSVSAAAAVREALHSTSSARTAAAARISERFALAKRAATLRRIVAELVSRP